MSGFVYSRNDKISAAGEGSRESFSNTFSRQALKESKPATFGDVSGLFRSASSPFSEQIIQARQIIRARSEEAKNSVLLSQFSPLLTPVTSTITLNGVEVQKTLTRGLNALVAAVEAIDFSSNIGSYIVEEQHHFGNKSNPKVLSVKPNVKGFLTRSSDLSFQNKMSAIFSLCNATLDPKSAEKHLFINADDRSGVFSHPIPIPGGEAGLRFHISEHVIQNRLAPLACVKEVFKKIALRNSLTDDLVWGGDGSNHFFAGLRHGGVETFYIGVGHDSSGANFLKIQEKIRGSFNLADFPIVEVGLAVTPFGRAVHWLQGLGLGHKLIKSLEVAHVAALGGHLTEAGLHIHHHIQPAPSDSSAKEASSQAVEKETISSKSIPEARLGKEIQGLENRTTHSSSSSFEVEVIHQPSEIFGKDVTSLEELKNDLVSFRRVHEMAQNTSSIIGEGLSQLVKNTHPRELAQALDRITSFFYREQQAKLRPDPEREAKKDFERHQSSVENSRSESQRHHYFDMPSVRMNAYQSLLSNRTVIDCLRRTELLLDNYSRDQQVLEELLVKKKEQRMVLEGISNSQDEIDKKVGELMEHAAAARRRLIAGFHNLGSALSLASSFFSLNSGVDSVTSALGLGESALNVNKAKGLQKYKELLSEGRRVHEKDGKMLQEIAQIEFSVRRTQRENWRSLRDLQMEVTNPQIFLKQLHEALESILSQNKETNLLIEQTSQKIIQQEEKEKVLERSIETAEGQTLEHHHRRQRKLCGEKTKLNDEKVETLATKNKKELLETELEELKKEESELNKVLGSQKMLNGIKETFYRVISEEAGFKGLGGGGDEAAIQSSIIQGYTNYNLARQQERMAANGGLDAIHDLLGEVLRMAGPNSSLRLYVETGIPAVALGKHLYNFWDTLKTCRLGCETLMGALTALQKNNPRATIFDAIQVIGPALFVGSYVTPGLQLASLSLGVLRIGQQLAFGEHFFSAERELAEIKSFLNVFSSGMGRQMNFIEQSLKNNHEETTKTLAEIMQSSANHYNGIQEALKNNQTRIVAEIKKQHDTDRTLNVKKARIKIELKINKYKERVLAAKSEEKKEKAWSMLCSTLENYLEGSFISDVYQGVERNRNGAKVVVEAQSMIDNPEIYSGAIALSTGYLETIASPFLLETILDLSEQLNTEVDQLKDGLLRRWEEIQRKIAGYQSRIQHFSDYLLDYTGVVLETQKQFFEEWNKRLEYDREQECIGIKNEIRRRFNNKDISQLGELFLDKASYDRRYSILLYLSRTMSSAEAPSTLLSMTGFLAAITSFVGRKDQPSKGLNQALFNRSAIDFVSAGQKRELPRDLKGTRLMSIEVGMDGKGSGFLDASGRKKTSSEWSIFQCLYDTQTQKLSTCPNSVYTVEEIDRVGQVSMSDTLTMYRKSLGLFNKYMDWLCHGCEKASLLQEENPFQRIEQKGRFVLSSNPSLLPLIFPKKLLDFCEEKNEIKTLGALTGSCSVVPFYDIQRNEKGDSWILKLFYRSKNDIQIVSYDIASFCNDSVIATVGTVSKNSMGKLNCFVLTAMYANYPFKEMQSDEFLGLPGSKTVVIKDKDANFPKGDWSIPRNVEFPGFFTLWEKAPSSGIRFSCEKYTQSAAEELFQQIQSEDDVLASNNLLYELQPEIDVKAVDILRKLRDNKELNLQLEHLKRLYDQLTALFSFSTSCGRKTIEDVLASNLNIVPVELADLHWHLLCSKGDHDASDMRNFGGIQEFVGQNPSFFLQRSRKTTNEKSSSCDLDLKSQSSHA